MERLVEKTKCLGWDKGLINIEVESQAEERAKLLLVGKILSAKAFSRVVVKEIIAKAWNTISEVEVATVDRNVFLFTFNHEVDVRRVWDWRPWSFKGVHLILKKYEPDWSFNEVDFTETDLWVQVHELPVNRQNEVNLRRIGRILGKVIEVDLVGNGAGFGKRYVWVRVSMEVNRPLVIGFPMYRKHLLALWILFKFEKLGNFCYGCGCLAHEIKSCSNVKVIQMLKEKVT